jgi:hypothetical protein
VSHRSFLIPGGALFSGASGGNPARLHLGFHYPRSRLTRAMSQEHYAYFMRTYGFLTRGVPINLYAIAAQESLVDYGTYRKVLQGEVDMLDVVNPSEFGLTNVEGAVLTGERHIVIEEARNFFTEELKHVAEYGVCYSEAPPPVDCPLWDWTIDCTFCAMDSANVDRYEPCVTGILQGPTNQAVTIMDGPFPSIYPWNESRDLCSITSAKWTPLARCKTRAEAEHVIATVGDDKVQEHVLQMRADIAHFWPASQDMFKWVDTKLSIRAMPRSGADARLVDVTRVGKRALRIRAGKIDAVEQAYQVVIALMEDRA